MYLNHALHDRCVPWPASRINAIGGAFILWRQRFNQRKLAVVEICLYWGTVIFPFDCLQSSIKLANVPRHRVVHLSKYIDRRFLRRQGAYDSGTSQKQFQRLPYGTFVELALSANYGHWTALLD